MMNESKCLTKEGKPKKSYSSKDEAQSTANHQAAANKTDLAPYQCKECGLWHLAPKASDTPTKKSNCLDSKDKPKDCYTTKQSAEKRIAILIKEKTSKPGVLTVYACDKCDGWHITSHGWS
jgi:hypothetical protein